MGIHTPDAQNMDELVTTLQEMAKDGPIDLRSSSKKESKP
jgi:hypothetical protein